MDDMLAAVKSIEMDGLVWGANKLVPIGYGIKKLQVVFHRFRIFVLLYGIYFLLAYIHPCSV